jgi:hypothetical protein
MEDTPKFKYVMAKYVFVHRSVWKVPAGWDNTKISVKWDKIEYDDLDEEEVEKMVKQKQGSDCFEADFKRPDETTENPIEGCQRGLIFGNRETIEDEGYYSCNDSGDEDETDNESVSESDSTKSNESEPDDDQPDDGWKY